MLTLRALAVPPMAALILAAMPYERAHPGACQFDARAHHIDDTRDEGTHRWHLVWSTSACSVEWSAVGNVVFAKDGSDIAMLDKGGSLDVVEVYAGHKRHLHVTQSDCMLTRKYMYDGVEQPYDGSVEGWFSDILVQVDRSSGALVDQRFPHLMAMGGPSAVLEDVAEASDMARTKYLSRLFMGSAPLDPAQWRQVAEIAGAMTSDYQRANLLVTAAPQMDFSSDESRGAYFEAVGRISSDYDKTRVLVSVASRGVPDDSVRKAYMAVAQTISSDAQRARALTALVRQE